MFVWNVTETDCRSLHCKRLLHLDVTTGNVDLWEYVDVNETLEIRFVFSGQFNVTRSATARVAMQYVHG